MSVAAIVLILALSPQCMAQEYAGDGQTIGIGARALGMGSAYVAVSDDATALYWNPAGLAESKTVEVQAQHTEQFGGTVNHDVILGAVPSHLGVFALGLVRLGVDGIAQTRLEDPSSPLGPGNRPVESATLGTTDYLLSFGYGRKINNQFSYGAVLKILWRNLSVGSGTGFGLDAGVQYRVAPRVRLGANLRDATQTKVNFDSGASDTISPTLDIGAAYQQELMHLNGSLIVSASILLNDSSSDADEARPLNIGLEFTHNHKLSAQLGLNKGHITAGLGLLPSDRFRVDAAFLEDGDLDNTYRLSASLYF